MNRFTNSDTSDRPITNMPQIVALDGLCTLSLIGVLKASGMSWGGAIFGGWIGGAAVTLGVMTLAAMVSRETSSVANVADTSTKVRRRPGPNLVPTSVTDPFDLWEADTALEIEYASSLLGDREPLRKPRRATPQMEVMKWDEDASDEERVAKVYPRRPVRSDRRQADDIRFVGRERRQANN